jgi:hypothetical protein
VKTYVHLQYLTPILLRIRNVSDKAAEKIKQHILHSITFFPGNHAIYEIQWKNVAEPDRPETTIQYNTIQYIHTACWITKATDTLRIYKIYCSSMATIVMQMRLNVALHTPSLSYSVMHVVRHRNL